MKPQQKTFKAREHDLKLALSRIQHGRSHRGEVKVTIAAVAREASVSPALIHNHYPHIAQQIREFQGKSFRAQRQLKSNELSIERKKNIKLRKEILELTKKVAQLASINECLLSENMSLKLLQNNQKVNC
jgi:AcrR family transcriptional regulator